MKPRAISLLLVWAALGWPDESPALDLDPGSRGILLTTIEGSQPQEIPVKYLGTYHDFAGPGQDVHMVELEGPVAERVGVANGMSGSPVYFDGHLLGALAYRLGALPKNPIAGVTPIERVLDASRSALVSGTGAEGKLHRIASPVFLGGLAPPAREWLAPQLERLGFLVVAGNGGHGNADPGGALAPGKPLGVELVRGDMRIAASGTVTLVDGDVVYAFGHPFLGTGPVELPMASAAVIHTLADWAGSYHMVNLGPSVGAILEDRQSAIVGRVGQPARMVPLRLQVRGGDYGTQDFEMEIVASSDLTPLLAGVAAANSLFLSNGYRDKVTVMARGSLSLEGLGELPLEMAFSSAQGGNPALAVAGTLFQTLAGLWANPFAEVKVSGLELEIDVFPGTTSYVVESLRYDRGPLGPGQPLTVRAVLREHRGETVTRELSLALPERLPRSGSLTLAVGGPSGIDGVLGNRVARRLQSATDLRAVIDALAEQRSAHRLTAVVYEQGGTVVSRGTLFPSLPPTAERLLSLRAASGSRNAKPPASPVARAEVELDGPVEGGVQLRLKVERGVLTVLEGEER